MRVLSLLTIFTVSLHQQCMPLSQYKVVCIPNTFDMLTAQKMKLWCQKWRLLLRKTYDPSRILLGDFLNILATLSQPEGIPWSTLSLIHRSGFFCGYLFYNAWRDSRIKLMKPCQDLQTPLLSWSWAWPISASMVLFHWRLGIPIHLSLFDIIWLLNVAFNSTTWCASCSYDSSSNPASRLVYPGYEVWTAGWHHQHIHQCGAQWHNQ